MRRTRSTLAVAAVLMQRPDERHWGYDTGASAGVRSGVLYPILGRMHEAGWLTDGWERRSEAVGRPPRRYYKLTAKGRRELTALLNGAGS